MNNQNSNDLETTTTRTKRIGQRKPLRVEQVWAIRVRLELSGSIKELALFNMAIDSML